jgi:predicted P-loop ATPase
MIWQIKRKLNGFATKYEMMFVLTGGQGAGKSHALRHYLFKALGDLAYSSAGFDALSDQREGRLFSDHYAIMFDEMSGAQKADMERVKQIITSGIIKQRRMGTTSHDSIPMNASFFGTANNPLETLIRDNTGMRRFWELKVDTADITRQKWGLLGTIDYMDIWRSADENAETSPIEPVLFDIQKTQETLRDLSIVEYLLEQNIVKLTDNLDEYSSATALQNTVSIVMGSHWSAKALNKEWQKHKIKKTHTTLGTRYGLKIVDSDVLNTLRTKYAMKLGGTDKEGYQL